MKAKPIGLTFIFWTLVASCERPLLTSPMSVIARAAEIQKASGLDVIWIQVGHFFEAYGPMAVELSKKLDMALASRNGVPKVGFPATHTRRWFEKTIDAGFSVGLAYQEQAGNYRLERTLVFRSSKPSAWDALPDESFTETGSLSALGLRGNGPLGVNEVFKLIEDVGKGNWRRLCTDKKCLHDSEFVKCVLGNDQAYKLLGRTAAQGLVIYPQAW